MKERKTKEDFACRPHVGEGERKRARREVRHALLEKQYRHFRRLRFTPAASRFHARTRVDQIISQGTTEPDAHGRGLVKRG